MFKFLNDTADQILSTVLIVFIIYAFNNGLIDLVESPPNPIFIFGVIGFGFILGVIKFLTERSDVEKDSSKNDVED